MRRVFIYKTLAKFPNMDLNVKDNKGNTILLAVVTMHFSLKTIQLLVEKGANPFVKNNVGENAMHKYMAGHGIDDREKDRDALNYLISLDIPINEINKYGETPLTLAAKHRMFYRIFTLIEEGANPNLGEIEGLSILDYLIKNRDGQFFSEFYAKGAKLTENTPFLALSDTESNCFEKLIDLNIDINKKNADGRSLLMESISCYRNDRTKLLIEKGIDVNIIDNNGDTALILATKNEDSEIVEILLNSNADANIKNNSGNNSMMIAKFTEQSLLLKAFEQHGFNITPEDEETANKILENRKQDNLRQDSLEQSNFKKKVSNFLENIGPNLLLCPYQGNLTIDFSAIITQGYKSHKGLGFGVLLTTDDIVPYGQLIVYDGVPYFINSSNTMRVGYSKKGNRYIGANTGFALFGMKVVVGFDNVKSDDNNENVLYLGFGFGY